MSLKPLPKPAHRGPRVVALVMLILWSAFPALAGRPAQAPIAHLAPASPGGSTSPDPYGAALDDTTYGISFKVATTGSMALALYTNAFIGNNLASRDPSLEYPRGSTEEHLVRAGLWVGALRSTTGELADADTLCSTATIDGYMGSGGETDSEFYPDVANFTVRSTLKRHQYWDPINARSYEDIICEYTDYDYQGIGIYHTPINIRVVQKIYQFDFEPYDALKIMEYDIINDDPSFPLYDVYVGLYTEFASGWKDGHDEWPPSGWFQRKDIAYVDSLRLLTEHHYNLDDGNCPSWAGCALLGTKPDSIENKIVSFNWWNWDPSGEAPETPDVDVERYQVLSNESRDATQGSEAPNNDPVTLLSVGPLGTASFADSSGAVHWFLEAGDTVSVAFAWVGGLPRPDTDPPRTAQEDIAFRAEKAQEAYDLDLLIPLPPPSPRLEVDATHRKLHLWWDDAPLDFIDLSTGNEDFEGFRVYISEQSKTQGFNLLGEYDLVDSLFYNTSLDAILADEPRLIVEDGDTTRLVYHYEIDDVRDGFKYWVSVTSFDTGSLDIGSLESGITQNGAFCIPGATRDEVPDHRVVVFPNPYHGDAAWDEPLARDRYLYFAGLPRRCTIRIFNLAGDLVETIEFDGDSYGATNVRGIFDPDDTYNPASDLPTLSGHLAAWDLTTREDQAVASGLYIFSVEDHGTGEYERGRFLIIK